MTIRFHRLIAPVLLASTAFADLRASTSVQDLIDALANHNPVPIIYQTGDGSAPDFAANFDWKEQARVADAIRKLTAPPDPKLWDLRGNRKNRQGGEANQVNQRPVLLGKHSKSSHP